MSESTQIVRPLQRGEFPPAYSTDELMRGVCHIVRDPFVRPAQKLTGEEVAHQDLRAHRDRVLAMLRDNRSKKAISSSLGVPKSSLSILISNDAELRTSAVRISSCLACDRHFDAIKRLASEGKSAEEIAQAIGLSWSSVKVYIEMVKELKDIYHSFGNRRIGRVNRGRWEKNREAILEALKTESFTAVKKRFGFRYDALRSYLDEVKNGK